MKAWTILFAVLLASFQLNAQNWAVFNPAYRYNYSLENESYTTVVIFADSNLSSGTNAVYSLNRIGVKCDTSQPSMRVQGCANPNNWLGNQPQFMQRRIVYSGQDYRLSDTGNYVLKHLEPVGSSWIFNVTYSITAQVQSQIQRSVFGLSDSVKTILLSTADTILLSKQFGILKYPARFGQQTYYKLRGIEQRTSYDLTALYGEKVPNYYEFFSLKPGVKMYYSAEGFYTQACNYSYYAINTVLNSVRNGTLITNSLQEQFYGCKSFSVCNTIPNPGCINNFHGPLPYNPYNLINSMAGNTLQINTNSYDLGCNGLYNNQLKNINYGASQMVVKFGMTANQHFYKSYGISCFSKHIRSKVINSGNYEVVRLEPTSTPDLYSPLPSGDFNASGEIYIEGYGKVNDYFFVFETKDVYCTSLIIDGADSLGGTDALTMGFNHALVRRNQDEVYPNPAKYRLHVAIPYEAQTNGKIILRNALGHVLQSIPADGQEVQELNIESYAPGIYFLSIQSPSYARTFKVLREE